LINGPFGSDDGFAMIKHFAAAGALVGLSFAFAPAASAADCGLLAVLSPCVAPPPAPAAPLVLPLLDPSTPVVAPPPAAPVAPPPAAPVAPAPAAPVATSTPKAIVPAAADRIHRLVNQDRAAAGLPALAASPRIASIAAGHSMAMATRGDIWHNDAYFTAANRRALGARALGENVAMNRSIDDAHRRLMASPGHRRNILDAGFDAVGIAVVQDESGTLYVTQNFADWPGEPAVAARPAAAKPTALKPASPVRTGSTGVVLHAASVAATPAPAPAVIAAPSADAAPVADGKVATLAAGPTPSPAPGPRPLHIATFAASLLASVAAAAARRGASVMGLG
jgi:uncharacterized protein YkwD